MNLIDLFFILRVLQFHYITFNSGFLSFLLRICCASIIEGFMTYQFWKKNVIIIAFTFVLSIFTFSRSNQTYFRSIPPQSLTKTHPCGQPQLRALASRKDCGRTNSCCLSHSVCGTSLQQTQQTNTYRRIRNTCLLNKYGKYKNHKDENNDPGSQSSTLFGGRPSIFLPHVCRYQVEFTLCTFPLKYTFFPLLLSAP